MIETFLTAYDPSDLPGTSVDPLGFERGYLLLADKILPGLTNVASRPRYFTLLCAGSHLAGDMSDATPRQILRQRQEAVLRLERFWALANVLARPNGSGGVRGVTYAKARADELQRSGVTRTASEYRLLSRQSQYGVIGMYANVADGMRFVNRDDFTLTPALGEVAAEAFLEETQMPTSLRRAVLNDGDIAIEALAAWGERAHIDSDVMTKEAQCMFDALHGNQLRSRMANLLHKHPWKVGQDAELDRLARITQSLRGKNQHADLREAIDCIQEFEACYQLALLALERLLWLCRHHAGACLTASELGTDPILGLVRERLPGRVQRFLATLDHGAEAAFRQDLDRLCDVRQFLEKASAAANHSQAFVDAVVSAAMHNDPGQYFGLRHELIWVEVGAKEVLYALVAGVLQGIVKLLTKRLFQNLEWA